MKIAHIASEVAPWCKSGGLGDVLGALPGAQARAGAEVAVFLPLHRAARQTASKRGLTLSPTGVTATARIAGHDVIGHFLSHTDADGVKIFLLDCQRFFDRDGLYTDSDGRSYRDNGVRYAFFCQAVLQGVSRLMGGAPDVLHAHDWQAALIPIYLRHAPIPTVMTIHNLAYQGTFHKDLITAIGLDWEVFSPSCAEFHDHLGLLKGGIACADAVTTVSPTYAREITTAKFGHGLHEFIRHHARRLTGIINGIDEAEWSPEHDPHIVQNFSAADLSGKWACRQALQAEFGLHLEPGEPLLAVVSRFASQKGLDLVADIAPELDAMRAGLVVLGTGEPELEKRFAWLSGRSRRVRARIGFDVPLAHRITAGADMFLMPSRFEPCGLNQMYAMAAGTVPIVHAVGGLADTVDDQVGFRFGHSTVDGLRWALQQAIGRYRYDSPAWHSTMVAGMRRDFSWRQPAQDYLALYRSLR
jgi:starch synthase